MSQETIKEAVNKLGSQILSSKKILDQYREIAEHHDTSGICDELSIELEQLAIKSAALVNFIISDES